MARVNTDTSDRLRKFFVNLNKCPINLHKSVVGNKSIGFCYAVFCMADKFSSVRAENYFFINATY